MDGTYANSAGEREEERNTMEYMVTAMGKRNVICPMAMLPSFAGIETK